MTERQLCDDAFHDARNREDTTNKARLPCPACGGTWVDYGRDANVGPESMDGDWFDLADDELRARLMQRGLSEDFAAHLVRYRDFTDNAHAIAGLLGEE